MTMVPNPNMEPNTVMDVVQKGYIKWPLVATSNGSGFKRSLKKTVIF
ncbi:hypothetical protein [Marinomonas gallaica]